MKRIEYRNKRVRIRGNKREKQKERERREKGHETDRGKKIENKE